MISFIYDETKNSEEKTLSKTAALHARSSQLLGDIRSLIESTRERVASAVNTGLVILYWRVGQRIRREILRGRRAEYGKAIVSTLWRQLEKEYGSGFSRKALFHKKSGTLILSQKMSVPDVVRSCNFVKLIRIGTIIPFHGDQTA
jgi:hypothetical protein